MQLEMRPSMTVGKKLAVVLSIVVIGTSAALFSYKGTSPLRFWGSSSDDPFGTQVERRVGPAPSALAQHLPAATAAIEQPVAQPDAGPTFHSSFHPVGTLLPPVDSVQQSAPQADPYASEPPPAETFSYARRHVVEDGDTLTRLAQQYLGRADAYLRIYEANRHVLSSPDLLPIGSVLTIPPREESSPARAPAHSGSLEMVPVPSRP
jgi:nucleoid-associated protein YgaU